MQPKISITLVPSEKLQKQKIYAKRIEGKRYDIGDKVNYIRATLDFALKREELKDNIKNYLKKLL